MSTPDPYDLAELAHSVRSALIDLPSELQSNPYRAGVLETLHPEVKDLSKMINNMFFFSDAPIDKTAMRGTLKSLGEVEGSMQLLITSSADYENCPTPAKRPQIEERWIRRRQRLEEYARLCAESLNVVLALSDTLGLPSVDSRSGQVSAAGSNFPDDTTDFEREGQIG